MGKAERDNKAFTDTAKLGAFDVSVDVHFTDGEVLEGLYAKRWVHNGPFLVLHGLTQDNREKLEVFVMNNIKRAIIIPMGQDKKVEIV